MRLNPLKTNKVFYCCFYLYGLVALLSPASLSAQVAISLGVDEVYDSNVFLEDRTGFLGAIGEGTGVAIPVDQDGKLNDDFITTLSLGASGELKLTPYLKTALEGKTGYSAFANESSESRFNLNSLLSARSTEKLLARPYFAQVASEFASGSQDIGVAEGSAARQSVTHEARLRAGLERLEFSQALLWSAAYQFNRHDFLGEWTTGSRSDRAIRERGSDYFSNGADSSLVYLFSERLSADLSLGTEYLSFTDVSSETREIANDELDRLDSRVSIGSNYSLSKTFQIFARVGLDHSYYSEDSIVSAAPIVEGEVPISVEERDDTELSLNYSAGFSYQPWQWTTLSLSVAQSRGTNLDGQRVTVRSLTGNLIQKLDEQFDLLAGGGFSQFREGDSLSGSTDRFEGALSLRFFLAQATSVSLGYNYVDQNADDDAESLLLDSTSYSGHRAFISLNSGLVGLL